MTTAQPCRSWNEPDGIAPRGTVVVLPGRGEHSGVYERFGRRLASDGYRVRALRDATRALAQASRAPESVLDEAAKLLRDETLPGPRVVVGADSGALCAARLAARGTPGLDGLILAGLPTRPRSSPVPPWLEELDQRTACPAHRALLTSDPEFVRGALEEAPRGRVPALDRVTVPVLGLHGADDPVSPLDEVRRAFSALHDAELVSVAGTRHDVLNDHTHRTVAATVVLFLERLRISPELPLIARTEDGS